ncbi:MAG: alginate export family protein [Cytophagaceae bacterium]
MKLYRIFLLLVISLWDYSGAYAQFTLSGQVRTRTEFRDGWGTLPLENSVPNFFTSQRTRLNVGYSTDRLKLFTAFQDIRVWGADMSTIANVVGVGTFLHEGWGEFMISDTSWHAGYLSLKLGRQEIKYDDARLLGNLDWLQQARRHDAAVFKYTIGDWQADLGLAYNQNHGIDVLPHNNFYIDVPVGYPGGTNQIGQMYKSMQYLYVAKKTKYGRATGLLFKDDFAKGPQDHGVYSRITAGGTFFGSLEAIKFELGGYYQGNNDRFGRTLDAYNLLGSVSYTTGKLTIGPGFDYLSGENTTEPGGRSTRFDPLYGTPHLFWGLMDYFFVATPYGVGGNTAMSPGLFNMYFKSKYKFSDKFFVMLDLHEFRAANQVADLRNPGETLDQRLGTELDLIVQYNLAKNINIQGGYCMMFGTETLNRTKAPAAADKQLFGQWAYLMINLQPDFLAGK